MANEIADWFNSIPFVTRYWFALSVIVPLLGRFGLLNPHWMILLWEPLFHKFQIWRPVTALFYFPLSPSSGFHYLINLFFLYNYSTRLESGTFLGRPADYLFMLVFCWLNLVIIGLLAQVMLLMDLMILAVLYVWCQLNRDQVVQFWFGTQFKAMYLPWVLLGFNMLLRGGGFTDVLGILVGHLYFFLAFKYPQDFGGPRWLNTPQIFYEYFPNQRGVQAGFGVPPTARRQGDQEHHSLTLDMSDGGFLSSRYPLLLRY